MSNIASNRAEDYPRRWGAGFIVVAFLLPSVLTLSPIFEDLVVDGLSPSISPSVWIARFMARDNKSQICFPS